MHEGPIVTPLETFLKAEDLDAVLRARQNISSVTPQESALIASVIDRWSDKQAVANLLFHADLIPASLRFEAFDRGLNSSDVPYFALAATVGLQDIPFSEVPENKRASWTQLLLALVQSKSKALAGRASVTLSSWSQSPVGADILPRLVSLYPVPDEGACRNIVAAVLATCGELPADDFDRRLSQWHLSDTAMSVLRKAHEDYTGKKAANEFLAMIMKSPVYAYIPNLSEDSLANVGPADLERDERPVNKPWWRFW